MVVSIIVWGSLIILDIDGEISFVTREIGNKSYKENWLIYKNIFREPVACLYYYHFVSFETLPRAIS